MPPVLDDLVMESSATTGTGAYALAGPVTGYRPFAVVGDGVQCYYYAADVDGNGSPTNVGWELGTSTYSSTGNALARTSVAKSSNANAAVNWPAGTRRIALIAPASAIGGAVGALLAANNLSDLASTATARTNLGLGGSATRNVGTGSGTVAAGDDSRLSDARTPTGAAGGALSGTYPNPTIANGAVTNAMLAGSIDLTAKVTGVLPAANGGLPTQSGNAGKYLKTDGTNASWAAAGGGTVVTGRAVLSATQGITGSATYQDVTDLSLTLPGAGTYLVTVTLYPQVNGSGTAPRIYARLVLNGSAVTASEFIAVQGVSGNYAGPVSYQQVITAAGAHTLKVQAARAMTGGSWTTSNINTSSEGGSYLEYVQLESTGGGGGSTATQTNLLMNPTFARMPQQARATLTGYATAAVSSSADQFATGWGVQHNAGLSNVQFRNWLPGDSSPPVAFSVFRNKPYLQVKNNSGSACGIFLYQFIETDGPDGVAAAQLAAQQIASSIQGVVSTGTFVLKTVIREWTGTKDQPGAPVTGYVSNVPTYATTNYAAVASGSGTLNTSSATQVDATGTPSSSCVNLLVGVSIEGLAAGASVYLSGGWLGRGSGSPAAWVPHPSDEELCLRYCETSYNPGTAPGTASVAAGVSGSPTPASIASAALACTTRYAVPKRATPTVTIYDYTGAAGKFSDNQASSTCTGTVGASGVTGFAVGNGSGVTFSPLGGGVFYHWISSARINVT